MSTAMEELELGPVLGLQDESTLKVWVRTEQAQALWVRWAEAEPGARWNNRDGFEGVPSSVQFSLAQLDAKSQGNGYYTAQAKLPNLKPDTRYFYEVVSKDELTRHPHAFCNGAPPSFRSLPQQADRLRFSFMSCHSVEDTPRRRRPDTMWQIAVNRLVAQGRAHFAILGGDQVYADSVPGDVRKQRRRNQDYSYGEAYADIYYDQWRWPQVRRFMAHMPCLMMWDDHDIINGWGSRGDEDDLQSKLLFGAACSAFDRHQAVHNPPGLGDTHRGFAFTLGSTGFLVLDGRSQRQEPPRGSGSDFSAVLGSEQWAQLKSWLSAHQQLTHLVVVTAIPLVFLPEKVTSRETLGKFVSDLVDQWSSPRNQSDQLKLIGTLFEYRKATGAQVLVLGGDVHVATTATIYSDDPRYLRPGETRAELHQVVSSGISHSPAIENFLYENLTDGQRLRERIAASFSPIFYSRSFAELELRIGERRVSAELFLEEENAARRYDWSGW